MFVIYYLSITTVGTMMTDWVNDVLFTEIIPPAVEGWLVSLNTAPWLQSLLLDGVIAGVGAVLGFLPQMMVLFLLLALLEDCGYMARIAFIMDRIFRRFGLSGKSFIPMLIGLGCGVPAVQASRTIENDRDRKMTIMTTTFIPCSAKLPIIGLIAGALFNGSGWVATSAYFVCIAAIIVSGIILKKTTLFAGDPAPFVMELPAYHLPSIKGVLIHMWDRLKAFVRKAGTIIFLSSIVIWFLSSFNFKLQMVDTQQSILSSLGKLIAPLFAPLGWGHWEAAVGTITGLVAKENVVATLGILFGFAEVAENGDEIWTLFAQNFTALSAYSFLVFNLLCAPCFCCHRCHPPRDGQCKMDPDCHWLPVYFCLHHFADYLPAGQLVHHRCPVGRHHRRHPPAGSNGLPAGPSGSKGNRQKNEGCQNNRLNPSHRRKELLWI